MDTNIRDENSDIALLNLMFINDSAFPTGSYAHSFGMETYIQEKRLSNAEELKEFCQDYIIYNLANGEAIFLKTCYQLLEEDLQEIDWQKLIELENRAYIFKGSAELRKASTMMGKQFLKTIIPLYDFAILRKWQLLIEEQRVYGDFVIIYAILASALGIDLETILSTYFYNNITILVYNAVRAIPLGQQTGISVLHDLFPCCRNTAMLVMKKSLEDISNQTAQLEISSMKHQFLYSRLFIS